MTLELRPLGVKCNIQCRYCYQNPQREAGNEGRLYDMQRLKAAIEAAGGPFAMFGGEPLLMPERDLEQLWVWGFERFGSNSIQTNGTLINDEHVRMFRAYKVNVGISIDGPGELNDVRWHGSLDKTRAATRRTEQAVERLCRESLHPSLIVTLHRTNASPDRLPRMHEWFRHLERLGVRAVRLHLLESETDEVRSNHGLTTEQNVSALVSFAELQQSLPRLTFDLFADMRRMLLGDDQRTACVWNACDPYTTPAVQGVEGNGERSNCGRTNKDGIDFGKSDVPGYERYLALYATPQDAGGCSGCRFFLMCKGQCPGTAIDGDWRNRTEHCEIWKAVYSRLEAELVAQGRKPLSLSADRERIEAGMLERWRRGRGASISQLSRWAALGTDARGG